MNRRNCFFLCGVLLTSLFIVTDPVTAQRVGGGIGPARVVPAPEYYAISLPLLQNGDFAKAAEAFQRNIRGAIKAPLPNGQQLLWLDSICYWTMLGEAHYQMGRYDDALQALNSAIQIYLNNDIWLVNVSFSGTPTAMPRVPLPWGVSARVGHVGNFSQCGFQILQENVALINLGNQGNAVMQQQQLTTIHAGEVVRCLAHAIRRRAEIQGPLAQYDPITKDLVQILGGRPCPPNHFTGTWVDVLYGLALSAAGQDATAIPELEKGLLMNAMFDHQLTPIALMELGAIAQRAGKYDDAISMYFEASLSSAIANDYILLEESFRSMANVQKLIDKTKPCLPCRAALAFFADDRKASPLVLVTLQQEVAEDALTAGQVPAAADLLNKADAIMRGRAMVESRYGARNLYLGAMVSYLAAWADYVSGKPASPAVGDKKLETALLYMRTGSLRLYHLAALDMMFQQSQIGVRSPVTPRIADELYESLLRDPTTYDWSVQPMDALAVMTFASPIAYQRWFYLAMQRGDHEKAFDISELARRAKFYSMFSLGPRLLSLRILFDSPEADLPQELILERQSLTLDFATFGTLSAKAADIRKQLTMLPITPKNKELADQQKNLLADLDRVSTAQELMLRPIALSRTKAPNIFPPIMKLERIREELPEKTAMLVFAEVLGDCYGFLVEKRNLSTWQIENNPRKPTLRKLIIDFLEELGNKDANRTLAFKELTDPDAKWKKAGNELLARLLGEQRQANFTELVIVPTGPLWYVPFEAMTVPIGDQLRPMIAAGDAPLTIRYAPTASLGVPVKSSRSQTVETLVLYGKLNTRDAPTVALDAKDRYTKAGVPRLELMASLSSEPSFQEFPGSAGTFVPRIRQLVVLDDVPMSTTLNPLDWTPFSGDRAKKQNTVATWLRLPWGGPQLIVMPGFHTPAENAMKQPRSGAKVEWNGDDLFLTALALQACGAKTVLLSRWKTGGRASYDLVGEFLQHYQTLPAADAWRQAILTVGGSPLHPEEEPRIKLGSDDPVPTAAHPFFWGAFILIDRGEQPAEPESKLE